MTAQKGWSRMIAARSQSWAAMSRPLWSWASSSHSNRNKKGPVGGDGSARMDNKVSERRIGAREGNPTRGKDPKGVASGFSALAVLGEKAADLRLRPTEDSGIVIRHQQAFQGLRKGQLSVFPWLHLTRGRCGDDNGCIHRLACAKNSIGLRFN